MKGPALAVASALTLGAFAVAGCGGAKPQTASGAGKGIGYGLRAAGLTLCVGPLSGEGDTSTPIGPVGPVSLTLYGEHGFAALVASGASAQQHAVALAIVRNHVPSSFSPAEPARTERSWRRQALKALTGPGVPPGPCRSEVPHLPVLGPTEVVCPDEVLIPLGRRAATDQFISALSGLVHLEFTPEQHILLSTGHYLTIPQSSVERRPYCGH